MKIFLIDFRNIAYRSFFAFAKEPLKTSMGRLTSVVYGVSSALNTIITDFKPDAIVFAEDSRGKTFRHEMYSGYKANRPEINPDFASQIPDLMKLIDAYGIKVVYANGFEADDVIGTLAKKLSKDNHKVFIVSNDKDFFQLVDDNISLCRPRNGGGHTIETLPNLINKFGCQPSEFIDYLALMGDASDNIPGVKGVGEKTAEALIKSSGSLDGIYGNLSMYKPAVQSKLIMSKSEAYLSKKLATIKTDVPLLIDINDYLIDYSTILEKPELKQVYNEFEFSSYKINQK